MPTKRTTGQFELVLENRQMVFIFFGAVMLCAVFFALGFLVGRDQGGDLSWRDKNSKSESREASRNSAKAEAPKAAETKEGAAKNPDQTAIDKELTFYKTVEGKTAQDNLKTTAPPEQAEKQTTNPATKDAAVTKPMETKPSVPATQPTTALPTGGNTIIFQVAALSKETEAVAMVRTLKEKGFQAFMLSPPADAPGLKLYRVQVGPFANQTSADQAKAKLVAAGYSPITKK